MVLNKHKYYLIALFNAIFFTFSGYFVLLMLCNNLVGVQYSRYFTIPIRLVIIISLFISLRLIGKKKHLDEPVLTAFLLFSFFYIARIFTEILQNTSYSISNETFLFYFLAFGFLPFVLFFLKNDLELDQTLLKYAVLSSGFILAIVSLIFYRDLLGTVGRISLAVSRDENYISPLALSYSGALTMGVAASLLLSGNLSKKGKILMIVVALISSIPFFLGASRGSVLALLLPFILFIYKQKNKAKSLYLSVVLVFAGFIIVLLSEFFGSSVISRFTSIEKDVSSGSSSADRTNIWGLAFDHFLNHPIFGHSLEVPEYGNYPHNVIIEVLLATGLLGFFPFLFLLWKAFNKSLSIFKNKPEDAWIACIFLQSIIQNLFSGSIYGGASWLWFSLAFILSMSYKYIHKNDKFSLPSVLQKA